MVLKPAFLILSNSSLILFSFQFQAWSIVVSWIERGLIILPSSCVSSLDEDEEEPLLEEVFESKEDSSRLDDVIEPQLDNVRDNKTNKRFRLFFIYLFSPGWVNFDFDIIYYFSLERIWWIYLYRLETPWLFKTR